MHKGIDISDDDRIYYFNDLDADFVIVKEGAKRFPDRFFYKHVTALRKAGVDIPAVYHSLYSLNPEEVRVEADACLSHMRKIGLPKNTIVFVEMSPDLMLGYAMDYRKTMSAYDAILLAKTWIDTVSAEGYVPGIYCYEKLYKAWFKNEDWICDWPLWIRDLDGDPSIPCTVHQYTWHKTINGSDDYVAGDEWLDDSWYLCARFEKDDVLDEEGDDDADVGVSDSIDFGKDPVGRESAKTGKFHSRTEE